MKVRWWSATEPRWCSTDSGSQTNAASPTGISGAGSISVVGGGSVTLNNLANSFTGNMLVNGSTLIAATANNTANETVGSLGNPSVARTITLTNGATLSLQGGNVLGGWGSTRCFVDISVNQGCQLALNVQNSNGGDSNPLGEVDLNGGTMSVGNGWAVYNQGAILLSNIVVGGTSPSTIIATGSDSTRNGINLGAYNTDASGNYGQNGIHFIVNSTGSSSADLTVSARLVDPPNAASLGSSALFTNTDGGVYKDGSGTMLLTAVNTYTGPTVINAGSLVVSSVQGINGMTNYVALNSGTTLGVLVFGTNQWSPSTIINYGPVTYQFTSLNHTNVAPLNPGSITGAGNGVTVNVYGALAVGQYRLIANDAADIGSYTLGTLPPGAVASLVADLDGTTIDLDVTIGSATFVWTGQTDTNWDDATSNWQTNGTATIYQDLVPVQFDDTATQSNVNLAVTVTPASVIVTNNALHYTISSAASNSITGSTSLTKNGSGILTLTNLNNSFTGGTVINAGTVEVSGNANLGSGQVQLSGGALSALQTYSNSLALTVGPSSGSGSGTIKVAAGQNLSIPNIITDTTGGAGTLVKTGAGMLTLLATNGYSGGTVVGNGTLVLSANTGSGGGAVHGALTVNPGATVLTAIQDAIGFSANVCASPVNIIGGTLTNSSGANEGYITTFNLTGGTMSSSGGSYNFNGTNSAINSLATNIVSTISGPVLLRADGLTINTAQGTVPSGVDLLISGNITQNASGYGIVKAGTGWLQLTGTNTYTGNTTIKGGTLELAQAFATLATNSSVIITNGAHLKLTVAGVTNKVTGLTLNGAAQANGYYTSGNSSGYITGSGVLQVGTVTGPTGPGSITNRISGNNLTLTWQSGQSWRLVGQTNSLLVGLTTNGWNTVPGGIDGSNSVTINPSNPSVFYKLVYP